MKIIKKVVNAYIKAFADLAEDRRRTKIILQNEKAREQRQKLYELEEGYF